MNEHKIYLRENCFIDFKKSIFMKKDLPCALTQNEIRLLELLTANSGQIVTYTALLAIFYDEIESRNLHVHMSRLRKKIEEVPRKPINLLSVRGIGYILVVQDPEIQRCAK
ncbi:winged helix-turn-helix domain-containing protein [Paenibacillus lutrae]|uniref:OmpR/PhoB-type domain-containing protein n=1 Tax=Paenibacillus lutrae TaxID=2078573 RepID=A0A7X3FKR4_9BACL|nr:helix-turn-helix domain-containing protein [Paenibacillus lutrae]MVP01294.1 hypothetical protein [Paenibacillus lutrae]